VEREDVLWLHPIMREIVSPTSNPCLGGKEELRGEEEDRREGRREPLPPPPLLNIEEDVNFPNSSKDGADVVVGVDVVVDVMVLELSTKSDDDDVVLMLLVLLLVLRFVGLDLSLICLKMPWDSSALIFSYKI